MANSDTPFGLKYYSGPKQIVPFTVTATYATDLFLGDVVVHAGTGYVERHTPGSGVTGVIDSIERSDGVMVSRVVASDSDYTYKVNVNICQDTLYVVQEDSDTTPVALASVGLNANLVYPSSASSYSKTTGVSNCELDSTSVASSTTLDVAVLGVAQYTEPDGTATAIDASSGSCKFLVKLHNVHHGNLGTGL